MNSDDDLTHHPDNLQAKPPNSFKPLIWKVIFILLLIVNIMFFSLVGIGLSRYTYMGEMSLIIILPLTLVLAIINLTVVASYAIKHHLHGIARVIWDAVLIVLGFVVIVSGIFISIILYR